MNRGVRTGLRPDQPSVATPALVLNDPLSSMSGLLTPLNGTWAITGGVLRQSSTAASVTHVSHATRVTPASARAVEVACSYVSGAGTIRRMGLICSSSNAATANLIVYADSADGTTFTLRVEADAVTQFFNYGTISYNGVGYLRIGVVQRGNVVDLYLNGTWLAAVAAGTFTAGGYVGLYTYGCSADFMDLKVWSYGSAPFAT